MAFEVEMKDSNFITDIIDEDISEGNVDGVHTRFPPEPNGYLHIGSAKAIYINAAIAARYNGRFNLRYDDTNPMKESDEFVRSILEDLKWLGAEPDGGVFYGSDYFEMCYKFAVELIKNGDAYVCDLSKEELAEHRGDSEDFSDKGTVSPYRDRPIEESLDLFERMKNGEFPDGARTLRAKIDPENDNSYLRDPVIFRIRHVHHHRQGDKWCIYPMYDFAHPICDYLQGVTHSLCTLEFEDHRPLYDWVGIELGFSPKPRQIEFARLNVTNLVMSKRYLKKLVEDGSVDGWDDPRMPTLAGLRNRGIPAEALKDFCSRIGVVKANSEVQIGYLEACVREYLNIHAERAMAVLKPLKVTITNYPDDKTEDAEFDVNPNEETRRTRSIKFSKNIYIDADDFSLNPPPKYFRLKKDGYVRLKGAYIIKCDDVVLGENGEVEELLCSYVPESKSGNDTSGIKVKGVVQWVNAADAIDVEIRKYGYLLKDEEYSGQDFSERMNRDSVKVFNGKAEPYIFQGDKDTPYQLIRTGYFKRLTINGKEILSEIVSLKDNFNK